MAGKGEFDPTEIDDKGTTGGARGSGNDDSRDWRLPDTPTETSDQGRKWWERGGARPKNPYAYQKLPEDIPMSKLPKEKSGLPTPNRGEGTAETSFTEGGIPETPT